MAKLSNWIESLSEGEPVEAVVFGRVGWSVHDDGPPQASDYGNEAIPDYTNMPTGKVLTRAQAEPWLNYEFCDGFGSPHCQSMCVWTKSWIISIYQYDGSTSPFRLPRNPIDFTPDMPGGG